MRGIPRIEPVTVVFVEARGAQREFGHVQRAAIDGARLVEPAQCG